MNQASTITMTATLTTEVNIPLCFDLLPVIQLKNRDGTPFVHPKNTRDKIPYFGVENAIICVKYKGQIRGIRQNEGQMNNVVSIDLQTGNKNVNIKLARSRVQLTGASSDKMGETAFKVLCGHLNMIQGHIDYVRLLSPETIENTVEFMLNNFDTLNYELISSVKNIDTRFALYLLQFKEMLTPEMFRNKVDKILNIVVADGQNVCKEQVDITDCIISNSVYNYNIGKEVSLIQLTKHLNKKGFNVSFHNWNSTHLKLAIPIFDDNSSLPSDESSKSGSSTSSSKIRAHRFCLHRSGSCKQTSPTSFEDAYNARMSFLNGISDYVME